MVDNAHCLPENIRKTSAAAWLLAVFTLVSSTAGTTYGILNVTVLSGLKEQSESLVRQNQRLADDLRTVQSRYDAALSSRDDAIGKKVSEVSAIYRESLETLTARYEQTLKENLELRNTLSTLDSEARQRAAGLRESRIRGLNNALVSNNSEIEETHRRLHEKSARAGYAKASCDRGENFYLSICEQASQYESEARSLREKISSLEKYGDILSGQILALEGKG